MVCFDYSSTVSIQLLTIPGIQTYLFCSEQRHFTNDFILYSNDPNTEHPKLVFDQMGLASPDNFINKQFPLNPGAYQCCDEVSFTQGLRLIAEGSKQGATILSYIHRVL